MPCVAAKRAEQPIEEQATRVQGSRAQDFAASGKQAPWF